MTRHCFSGAVRQLLPLLALVALLLLPALSGAAVRPLIDTLKGQATAIKSDNLKVDLLLRGIGKQAGVNIVVASNIDDTITLDVDNISLYEVFHLILDTKQLHYYEKNNVIFVERGGDFQSRQQDVVTVRVCTQYGNAGDYLEALKPLLSGNGSLTVANRNNCLIVRDRDVNIARIEEMLAELDTPMPQVHIEARVVSITTEAKRQLGIVWGYDNLRSSDSVKFTADLALTSPSTNLTFGFLRNNLALDIDLQALQQDNKLEILSAPRIMVMNGKEAEIKQGKEVPYVTQSGDLINTSFREANLGLKVTPHIIQNEFIDLKVVVNNDSVDQATTKSGEPLINKQEISTSLFLKNGVTAVIGGILQENKENQDSGVPGLADLPLLGLLFKSNQRFNEKTELVVFITPTILNLKAVTAEQGENPEYAKKVLNRQREGDQRANSTTPPTTSSAPSNAGTTATQPDQASTDQNR